MSLGETEKAIEELEIVLSNPAWISVEYLKADPIFEPLHQNTRFLALSILNNKLTFSYFTKTYGKR